MTFAFHPQTFQQPSSADLPSWHLCKTNRCKKKARNTKRWIEKRLNFSFITNQFIPRTIGWWCFNKFFLSYNNEKKVFFYSIRLRLSDSHENNRRKKKLLRLWNIFMHGIEFVWNERSICGNQWWIAWTYKGTVRE